MIDDDDIASTTIAVILILPIFLLIWWKYDCSDAKISWKINRCAEWILLWFHFGIDICSRVKTMLRILYHFSTVFVAISSSATFRSWVAGCCCDGPQIKLNEMNKYKRNVHAHYVHAQHQCQINMNCMQREQHNNYDVLLWLRGCTYTFMCCVCVCMSVPCISHSVCAACARWIIFYQSQNRTVTELWNNSDVLCCAVLECAN